LERYIVPLKKLPRQRHDLVQKKSLRGEKVETFHLVQGHFANHGMRPLGAQMLLEEGLVEFSMRKTAELEYQRGDRASPNIGHTRSWMRREANLLAQAAGMPIPFPEEPVLIELTNERFYWDYFVAQQHRESQVEFTDGMVRGPCFACDERRRTCLCDICVEFRRGPGLAATMPLGRWLLENTDIACAAARESFLDVRGATTLDASCVLDARRGTTPAVSCCSARAEAWLPGTTSSTRRRLRSSRASAASRPLASAAPWTSWHKGSLGGASPPPWPSRTASTSTSPLSSASRPCCCRAELNSPDAVCGASTRVEEYLKLLKKRPSTRVEACQVPAPNAGSSMETELTVGGGAGGGFWATLFQGQEPAPGPVPAPAPAPAAATKKAPPKLARIRKFEGCPNCTCGKVAAVEAEKKRSERCGKQRVSSDVPEYIRGRGDCSPRRVARKHVE